VDFGEIVGVGLIDSIADVGSRPVCSCDHLLFLAFFHEMVNNHIMLISRMCIVRSRLVIIHEYNTSIFLRPTSDGTRMRCRISTNAEVQGYKKIRGYVS